ncbi:MAG: tetratricopeptide repeat protein [Reyranella sp.]|jgi:predicted O-linked N-acetylglucosamine transferase (SPINDLY family)|uniref:O-linked N-acetylglucosamine transferase, SPINDLY family protein n=1 Tax=Reyranella sp. TaxID=1929291 RepID=UPI0025F9DE50|nr:tetratricopeptide repeat protein [Reyranella sp.]MBR2816437.1 tetratricopeptide repeat protein [Reyranella sp.]
MPPGSPDLARQLVDDGNAAMRQERYDTALAKYRQALKLVPGHPGILNNCAVVLEKLNRLEEAYAAYEQVRRAMPNHPGVLNNCGVVLHKLGKLAEALDQFDRALAQKADYAEALNNRGNVLLKLLRPLEALNSYDRALALRPDHPETLHNRATPLQQLKRYEEAAASLSRAIELAPGLTAARERLFYNRLNYCDWTDYDSAAAAIVADMEAGQTSCDPFFFLGVGRSLAAQRQCAETFAAAEYPVVAAAPPRTRHRKDDRIHIAYVSADFRQHAVAHLTASLFEDHDRRRFEVTGISLGPDDGSEMRQRLQRAFDRFVDVRGKSDHDVAELMRRLKVDIAINLNGYTEGHRTQIFAHRPASVQASYLGYSGTMGAPFIDYIIADSHVIPADLAAGYAEHVVRLPDSFMPSDRNRPIPGETPSRDTVGLPETGFVFCAFNAGYKMRPDVFGVWMKLLRQVDGSLLWLRDESPESTANLRRTAEQHGIAPGRLIFASRVSMELHLARHGQAGLFLDSFPYGAHTTANDALWAGLPMITLVGETFVSRVGASLLQAVSLPELVTTSIEDYEALALKLATTPALLGDIREKLARQRHTAPLFDTSRTVRHLEQAYRVMHERHRRGEPPASFNVDPAVL